MKIRWTNYVDNIANKNHQLRRLSSWAFEILIHIIRKFTCGNMILFLTLLYFFLLFLLFFLPFFFLLFFNNSLSIDINIISPFLKHEQSVRSFLILKPEIMEILHLGWEIYDSEDRKIREFVSNYSLSWDNEDALIDHLHQAGVGGGQGGLVEKLWEAFLHWENVYRKIISKTK